MTTFNQKGFAEFKNKDWSYRGDKNTFEILLSEDCKND